MDWGGDVFLYLTACSWRNVTFVWSFSLQPVVCAVSKQLGFLWSGMIVKQLITLSLPLPAFSSANCWTIKLSIQFTKAVLWKLFCGSCVVCTARDGNTSQLYGFMLESFFFLNVNINIFSSENVFFFLWIPFPFYSLSRSLSCWIYEIHLPRREFHTVDCGK